MDLPSLSDIEMLHRKYAPTDAVYELVFTHCRIIWELSEQLINARKLAVNVELVRAGSLLHDIGVYPLFDANGRERPELSYITHGVRGEAILKEEGLPEALWRIASHHTGMGLSKDEIISHNLPLPPQDYEDESLEESIVMYADKFHSKTEPPLFNSFEWYKGYVSRFGEAKVKKFDQMAENFGIPDLEPLIKKYRHSIRTNKA